MKKNQNLLREEGKNEKGNVQLEQRIQSMHISKESGIQTPTCTRSKRNIHAYAYQCMYKNKG